MTGDYYWNIHVTPEKDFSYASFETNYPKENYEELLKQVIEIFKPGHINVTVMANKVSQNPMYRSISIFNRNALSVQMIFPLNL